MTKCDGCGIKGDENGTFGLVPCIVCGKEMCVYCAVQVEVQQFDKFQFRRIVTHKRYLCQKHAEELIEYFTLQPKPDAIFKRE